MKRFLIAVFMVCYSVVATATSEFYNPRAMILGERTELAVVRFHTDQYNLLVCRDNKNPNKRIGFHVAQLKKNGMVLIFCGTKFKTGDIIKVTFNDGI